MSSVTSYLSAIYNTVYPTNKPLQHIEPVTAVVAFAILNQLPAKTKLGVNDQWIYFSLPPYEQGLLPAAFEWLRLDPTLVDAQGMDRRANQLHRDDLGCLGKAIKAARKFWKLKNDPNMQALFREAALGAEKLRSTYETESANHNKEDVNPDNSLETLSSYAKQFRKSAKSLSHSAQKLPNSTPAIPIASETAAAAAASPSPTLEREISLMRASTSPLFSMISSHSPAISVSPLSASPLSSGSSDNLASLTNEDREILNLWNEKQIEAINTFLLSGKINTVITLLIETRSQFLNIKNKYIHHVSKKIAIPTITAHAFSANEIVKKP